MKHRIFLGLLALLSLFSSLSAAQQSGAPDRRTSLGLSDTEKAEFLSEMRQMLISIQGILQGIGSDDRDQIARSARKSGNRMARATRASIRDKLPEAFKQIGGPTHLMFEELAIRAEMDDMETIAEFTGQLMGQCIACHASFKVD